LLFQGFNSIRKALIVNRTSSEYQIETCGGFFTFNFGLSQLIFKIFQKTPSNLAVSFISFSGRIILVVEQACNYQKEKYNI